MWEKPIILAVDDEPLNLELMKAILPSKDYYVVTANNGAEALEILSTQKIDLLLLDVMMPLIDGFEVTRWIRGNEKTKKLPVILITALGEACERIMGIEAGCDEFVSKPFDKNEVLARIKTLLKLNFYRSQVDEKEKFEHVINGMNDGLIVCDAALNIVRTNQKGRELLGSEDLSSGWIPRLNKTYTSAYKGDLAVDLAVHDLDFDLERPATSLKRLLIVSVSTSVIKDTEGGTVSVVIVLHDVTEQRKENFQKENFLSLMSWKLRAPLAASLERLDLIQKSALASENMGLKKSVEAGVDTLSDFLNSIEKIFDYLNAKDSDRFQQDQPGMNAVSMPRIETLVREAIQSRPDKMVECRFELAGGLSVPISDAMFEIVVKNIVENSIKFSKQPVTKMLVSAAPEGKMVRFKFTDNGPGIPSEEKREVFDAFHPFDQRDTLPAQGMGLGLAIVKKIIDGNLGDVQVDDAQDQGTCISFTLPMSKSPAPDFAAV